MKNLAQQIKQFLAAEDGPTAVEYAVMLALIVIVCIAAITVVGTNTSGMFNTVATQLGSSGGGGS
jgi:pilus assembly protein Flp/PilA